MNKIQKNKILLNRVNRSKNRKKRKNQQKRKLKIHNRLR